MGMGMGMGIGNFGCGRRPRYEHGRAMLLGGPRRRHPFSESGRGIAEQWQELRGRGRIPGRVGAAAYGVMCGHDAGGFEYMCGVEVESFEALPADLGRMRITPQHYAVFLHRGPVATIRTTWERILLEWLPSGGYQSAHRPDFEVYARGLEPGTEPGDVEIWIAVVRGGQHGA